jgi:trimethylamine--corrinoid protein Co-methyltransferase
MPEGSQTVSEAKGVRTGRRARAQRSREPRIPVQIRRPQGLRLTLFREQDNLAIHKAALQILWDIGVIIDDSSTRELLLRQQGCQEGKDGYIVIHEDAVTKALSTVPSHIELYDREGNKVVDTAKTIPTFCAGHNCVNVLDHETGEHRPGTLADIEKTSRVCEGLPNIDVLAGLGFPQDVPVEDEAVESARALARHSKKPIAFTGHDEIEAEAIWTVLADAVGGWDALAEKPCGLDLTGPVSPLKLGEELCRRLKLAAERSLPIVCYPALFPGMAGPITLAGAIAQSSAESLAGVVIHQLYNPGAPIMAGSSILPMDMRRADLAYGSPEYMLANLGATDYFNSIGFPSWIGAGCSDSHVVDLQSAAEVGSNMSIATLAGTSFIHNLGYLSGGRTGSLEMLVLCDELAGMASKFAGGISVDEETLAVDVIQRSAKENTFLTDSHTTERYLQENWFPSLFERSDLSLWKDSGAKTMRAKIKDRLSTLLAANSS